MNYKDLTLDELIKVAERKSLKQAKRFGSNDITDILNELVARCKNQGTALRKTNLDNAEGALMMESYDNKFKEMQAEIDAHKEKIVEFKEIMNDQKEELDHLNTCLGCGETTVIKRGNWHADCFPTDDEEE